MTAPSAFLRAAALALLFLTQAAWPAPKALRLAGTADFEPPARGLIVRMNSDASPSDWERMTRVAGLTGSASRDRGPRSRVIGSDRLLSGAQAREIAQALSREPGVAWAEPNTLERRLALQTPNDPLFATGTDPAGWQWWLRPVSGSDANAIADRLRGVPGFQTAWGQTTGSANTVIAVLDTGYTLHPDLAGRVINGYDFVSEVDYANDGDGRDASALDPGDWVTDAEVNDPTSIFFHCTKPDAAGKYTGEDSSWHGTIIAGQLVAQTNNALGVAAMQWQGKVLAVRVAGKCGATVSDIVDGIRWSAGIPVAGAPTPPSPAARVITISFGGDGACSNEYQSAISDARARGAVVVAAAGNDHGKVLRPAKCPGVIGVGAVNRDGFKTSYSNFGPELSVSTVGGDPSDLGAWGSRVGDSGLLTVYNDGAQGPGAAGYAFVFGTSFSTPIVAGAASLMLAVNPQLTADQIVAGLEASARPHVTSPVIGQCSDANPGRCICTASTCGAGLLDVPEALRYAANPAAYVPLALSGAVIDSAEVRAAAALGPDLPPNAAPSDSGGSGGGALGWPWLLALALAVWAARHARSG